MSDIQIDRLTLKLSGLSGEEGRRLATLITEGLASADIPRGARPGGAMRLELRARPGDGVDELARQAIEELVREISRSV